MEIISKISVKTCKAVPQLEIVTVDGKQVPRAKGNQHLLRIVGVTNAVKKGMSEFGPWVAFLGSFEGTNVQTGEVFRSSKCLLPESATAALNLAVNGDNMVEFGFDIGVKPASTPTGYEYTVTPLLETADTDPLQILKNKMSGVPALAAPTAAPALADETKKTKAAK
jgi:hypothetical protein